MGLGKTYSTSYLADSSNNTGAVGQVLISTATGINWVDIGSVPGTLPGGPYLPLSAGSGFPLTATLYGTGANFSATGEFGNMLTINIDDISTGENRGLKLNNFSGTPQVWNITAGQTGVDNDKFTIRDSTNDVDALTIALSGGVATFAGGGSFGGNVTGVRGLFNSGTTNVVATFTSTDGTAGIGLIDSTGNVELSASGNVFQVQPAGGTAQLTVSDSITKVSGMLNIIGSRSTYVDNAEDDTATAHIFTTDAEVGDFDQLAGSLVLQARVNDAVYRDIIFAGGLGTAADPVTPLMTILGQGEVGIGTDTPNDKLEVSAGNIRISNNSPILRFIDTDVTDLQHRVLGGGNAGLEYSADVNNVASGYHRWDISNSEKMRLIENGNLGIGITNPSSKLELWEVSGAAPTMLTLHGYAVDTVADDTMGAFIDFKRTDGNASFTPQARIGMLIRDSNGDNGVISEGCGNLVFHTSRGTDAAGAGEDVERMRITDIGDVGIGTDSPTAKLHVQGSSATDVPIIRSGGFGNSGSKLELAETLTSGDMNYGFSFFNDGNSTNTLKIKRHDNSTTGEAVITLGRTNNNVSMSGGLTLALKATSSSTLSTDGGTTLTTKNYVDAHGGGLGPFLPLAAGSGSSLTDNLYINDVDQNNDNRYGNLQSEVGFTRSPSTGSLTTWFKVVELNGSPKRIKFSIIATGDNTNSYDNFLISTSGYGMYMHIQKLPGGRYNGSKLLSVAAVNPSNGGGVEIWIKLSPISSGTGATYVACTSDVLASATILASATATAPTLTANDTQLDISSDNRFYATLQASRGATFGAKVGIGTNAPSAMLTVAGGDATISGNAGIGTTDTSRRLSVFGSNTSFTTTEIPATIAAVVSNQMTDNNYHSILQLVAVRASLTSGQNSNGYLGFSTIDDSNNQGVRDAGRIAIVNEAGAARNSPTALTFWTNTPGGNFNTTPATEKMRITSGGNVGIGTEDPDDMLEVYGSSPNIRVTNTAETDAGIVFNDAQAGTGQMAAIKFNSSDEKLKFFVNDEIAQRMVIDTSGNVGINAVSPGYKLDVTGTIRATGDIIAFSDVRVKENIKTIKSSLDKVSKLRGVEFNKIGEDEKSIGVIAQEIEKVIPEVVKTDDEGMKSVAYGNISGLLIEAIKELKAEIDLLKSKPCNCNCKK